MLGVTWG